MLSFRSRDSIVYALLLAASMGLVFTYSELKQQQQQRKGEITLPSDNSTSNSTNAQPEASAIHSSASQKSPPSSEYLNLLSELKAHFVNRPEPWFEACKADSNSQHFIRFFFNWNKPPGHQPRLIKMPAEGEKKVALESSPPPPPPGEEASRGRTKRSIATGKDGSEVESQRVFHEKASNIVYKHPEETGVKKTSFSSFNSYSKKKLKRPGSRFFYSQPDPLAFPPPAPANITSTPQTPPITTTSTTTTQPPRAAVAESASGAANQTGSGNKQLERAVDSILLDRIRVNIKMNIAMKVVAQVGETIGTNLEITKKRIYQLSAKAPSEAEIDKRSREWSAWVPEVNISTGFNGAPREITMFREIGLLMQLDEKLQHFTMAMEQLNFDKPLYKNYRKLERLSLKILCELDSLVDLFKLIVRNQTQLVGMLDSARMLNLSELVRDNSSSNALKLLETNHGQLFSNPKTYYTKQIIKSALDQVVSKTTLSQVPKRRLVERSLMPETERCVPDELERCYRDLSILRKFNGYISQHKLVVMEILNTNTIEDKKS